MSEEAAKDEKTEEPSQRRIQRSFDDGEIPLGKDFVAVAGLGAGALALISLGGSLRDALVSEVAETLRTTDTLPFDALPGRLGTPALLGLVVCIAAALGAALAAVIQTRGQVWGKLASPDPKRLFQLKRLTRLFGREFVVDLLLAALKVVLVAWVIWSTLRDDFLTLPTILLRPPGDLLLSLFGPLARGTVKVMAVLAVIAGIDFAVTRHRFLQKMKMTKDEARREHKEDEGDPLIRARRKRQHRELAKNRIAIEVPKADAIVVNPTHVAIAIRYRKSEGKAPRVTAKGKGKLAEMMRDLARSNGVPIVQDVPLARLLYRKVKVGREVPAETYKAVAAVLAFVYRVTGRKPGNG